MFFIQYIKKEDAKDLVKRKRKFVPITLFAVILFAISLQFFVYPELKDIYNSINEPVPFTAQVSSYVVLTIVILCILLSIYLLTTPPKYEKLDKALSKYKNGEMISTNEIIDFKYEYISIIILCLFMVYCVFSIILPMYTLISK